MKLITKTIQKRLDNTPPYEGDSSRSAPIIVKFFGGCYTFLCTSAEKEGDDYILLGYASFGNGYEYGSVMLSEILSTRVPPFGTPLERDKYLSRNAKIGDYM